MAAPPHGRLRVARYFAVLIVVLAGLYALVFFTGPGGTIRDKLTPSLGLDLQGGTTVTLKAVRPGGKNPDKAQLEQARQIIENRVNGSGVGEFEVITEGGNSIVINVPGHDDEGVKKIGQPAQLRFRQVAGSANDSGAKYSNAANDDGTTDPQKVPSSQQVLSKFSPEAQQLVAVAQQSQQPIDKSRYAAFDVAKKLTPAEVAALPASFQMWVPQITCAQLNARQAGSIIDKNQQVVSCENNGHSKYLLDQAKVVGTDVRGASFNYDPSEGWKVSIKFTGSGQERWTKLTKATVGKQVAVVLDNQVVSAPEIQNVITGDAQITGGSSDPFTKSDAQTLSNQLKYGALPLTFSVDNASSVSPTLGLQQLRAGLLAGGIGLVLVVLYSLLYYRGLGLVTIASLVISGLITYAALLLAGTAVGFTLTLAGIAGFIVAVGITADSFVVYFERIKDEIREGRSGRSAVPRAWVRARKTILSADAVSFLAAAVLYILALGPVKGFAFTLGLSTIVDLVVVFLFTHPLVVLFSRSKKFGTSRVSGLGRLRRRRTESTTSAVVKES